MAAAAAGTLREEMIQTWIGIIERKMRAARAVAVHFSEGVDYKTAEHPWLRDVLCPYLNASTEFQATTISLDARCECWQKDCEHRAGERELRVRLKHK
jgi:hypothetical protein